MTAILDRNAGNGKANATPALSIVIPAYNEAGRLPQSLQQLREFFDEHPLEVEILVMVERSKDNTLSMALEAVGEDARFRIIDNLVQRGKGYAVRCGMRQTIGDIIVFMDADLSTPLEEILDFLDYLQGFPEVDVLIGSRELAQSRVEKPQNALRRNMGRTFNKLVQHYGIAGITDTQCGFKAFRRDAAREIFARQKLDGFAFDVEVLMLAQSMNFRVDVLPVRWFNSADSRVNIVRDSWRMFRDLLRIRRLVKHTLQEQPLSGE